MNSENVTDLYMRILMIQKKSNFWRGQISALEWVLGRED